MSIALATKGVVCVGGFSQGSPEYHYYCVDLPEVLSSKDISPNVEAKTTGAGSRVTVEELSPKLTIK
jgi:hypothetical protein